jgi:hypothetical protein
MCSAIKLQPENSKYFHVFCGFRHADIYEFITKITKPSKAILCQEGFMTSDNQFVDRYQAARIAYDARQITLEIPALYSEDIWPE